MDTIIITKLQRYTYLFLPCDEIPVVNQPLSQLLWYVHLDLLVRGGLTLNRKYIIYTNLYKAYRKSFVHYNYCMQDGPCIYSLWSSQCGLVWFSWHA